MYSVETTRPSKHALTVIITHNQTGLAPTQTTAKNETRRLRKQRQDEYSNCKAQETANT